MPTYTRPAPFPKMDGSQPCTLDPDLWTPDQPEGPEAKKAAELCRSCPFIEGCFAYGVTHAVSGVYGGMTTRQRQNWRRKHNLQLLDVDDAATLPRVDADSESCRQGHPRTPENAYRGIKGGWECRPCRRIADARRKDKRAASYAEKQAYLAKRREYRAAERERERKAAAAAAAISTVLATVTPIDAAPSVRRGRELVSA